MINQISREEVLRELVIDENTLVQYETFLEMPVQESYDIQTAKLFERIHELVRNGLSMADIRQLSFCAEQYSEVVPALKSFEDFLPQNNLRELVQRYAEMINEMTNREHAYQEKIEELVGILEAMQKELEANGINQDQLETFKNQQIKFSEEIDERDKFIKQLAHRISELEVQTDELEFQNVKKTDEIEKLKAEAADGANKMTQFSAVDIDALLRKKEKEVALRYQREILDLKKQVDIIVETKQSSLIGS